MTDLHWRAAPSHCSKCLTATLRPWTLSIAEYTFADTPFPCSVCPVQHSVFRHELAAKFR